MYCYYFILHILYEYTYYIHIDELKRYDQSQVKWRTVLPTY